MISPDIFERRTTVTRVVDGDTLYLDADLGCDVHIRMTVRLYGINCPEVSTQEGRDATVFTTRWVTDRGPVFLLRTVKDKREKYGRYLADLLPLDGSPSLCSALLDTGHAQPYLP